MKEVDEVTVDDLIKYPVWEHVGCETTVRPVIPLPVDSLQNRAVGTQVKLANGSRLWAVLSNISLRNPRHTSQFLALSIEKDGKWFHLPRYFDVEYDRMGPKQLAEFLGLPIDSVFPIEYDLSGIVKADTGITKGYIPLEPEERLSEDELMNMAVMGDGE
jgi:hypothetical protein